MTPAQHEEEDRPMDHQKAELIRLGMWMAFWLLVLLILGVF